MFIADVDTYPFGPDAPFNAMFVQDIAQVVNTSYYGFDPFLTNQDKFNFWVVLNQGRADDANDGSCDHDLPSGGTRTSPSPTAAPSCTASRSATARCAATASSRAR